jgi:hypothetical protein
LIYLYEQGCFEHQINYSSDDDVIATSTSSFVAPVLLDKVLYDQFMNRLANYPLIQTITELNHSTSTTGNFDKKLWPVKAPYPNVGALLPFDRIVAYYGNFYSGALGVLGAYPKEEMIQHLMSEVKKWQEADPETKAIPALDYIAITAQGSPGSDGMYRARMPASEIQKAVDIANEIGGIVVLDVQVGKSTLEKEIPTLEQFLKLPNVELAIDPEFSMKDGHAPGRVIGTFDAVDINYAAEYLAQLVKKYNIPPKVLIVHRFTEKMVTHYENIKPLPEVQILVDMDGYGNPPQKKKAYEQVVADEPVQFTGLKLFYKNDVKNGSRMITPEEAMTLQPRPSFIQYQ